MSGGRSSASLMSDLTTFSGRGGSTGLMPSFEANKLLILNNINSSQHFPVNNNSLNNSHSINRNIIITSAQYSKFTDSDSISINNISTIVYPK